jgi:hypothetical protein
MSFDSGTHHVGTHAMLRLVIVAMLALALILTLEVSPTAAASAKACRVTNTDSGRTFPRLQQAVDAATPGERLVVKGTCVGRTNIDRDLVITGVRTPRTGRPVLQAPKRSKPLGVAASVSVTLIDLTVRDGNPPMLNTLAVDNVPLGGGIDNRGTLTLNNVTVRDNKAGEGGGVYNRRGSSLTLEGRTRIVGNSEWYGYGGGVYLMRDSTLVMNDSSRIVGNFVSGAPERSLGGGVYNAGTVTMNDASRIRGNTSGGVYNASGGILFGVVCGQGGNVTGNTPDDCYIEP